MYNNGNSSKNVTGASIVDGTVETVDIADDAVTADKLANSVNTDIATGVTASTTAGDALPKAGGAMTGAITTTSTFDGRDVATDGAALDVLDLAINSAANAEAVSIDVSGGVHIGGTSEAETSQVSFNPSGYIKARKDGTSGIFDRITTNGVINEFRKDGVAVGAIGNTSWSDELSIYTAGKTGLTFSTDGIIPTDGNGAYVDNTKNLGHASYRFKDLILGGNATVGNVLTLATTTSRTGEQSLSLEGGNAGLFFRKQAATAHTHVIFWRNTDTTTTAAGFISSTGTSVTYATSSDYRMKENVLPMVGSIDRLKALKPSSFNFISEPAKTVDGFLAHEAQAVVPEAVQGTKDGMKDIGTITNAEDAIIQTDVEMPSEVVEGETWTKTGEVPDYQGIDQSKLVPLLVSALQEAIARIETLENA